MCLDAWGGEFPPLPMCSLHTFHVQSYFFFQEGGLREDRLTDMIGLNVRLCIRSANTYKMT